MWKTKPLSFHDIGIEGLYTIPSIPRIEPSLLPIYNEKDKRIESRNHSIRSSFQIESQIDHGSYGNIYIAKRGDLPVLLKQPRMSEMNLLQEAVLQYLAFKTLEAEGISWAVPKVYDVFLRKNEICFSMERIHGYTIPEWFSKSTTPDTDTLILLVQICQILTILETYLNLDHRDLKSNNLLLLKEPCTIRFKVGDDIWRLKCPFKVIVLDFGFACLGSENLQGIPLVNLGDGVLPPMDPCPKEGRDIFHLLVSLLGLPIFRDRITKELHDKIDGWLSLGKKTYGTMARRWSTENWSYLVSSQPNFSIPNCCPSRILKDIVPMMRGNAQTFSQYSLVFDGGEQH
jgi:serine/threonine protein kinase